MRSIVSVTFIALCVVLAVAQDAPAQNTTSKGTPGAGCAAFSNCNECSTLGYCSWCPSQSRCVSTNEKHGCKDDLLRNQCDTSAHKVVEPELKGSGPDDERVVAEADVVGEEPSPAQEGEVAPPVELPEAVNPEAADAAPETAEEEQKEAEQVLEEDKVAAEVAAKEAALNQLANGSELEGEAKEAEAEEEAEFNAETQPEEKSEAREEVEKELADASKIAEDANNADAVEEGQSAGKTEMEKEVSEILAEATNTEAEAEEKAEAVENEGEELKSNEVETLPSVEKELEAVASEAVAAEEREASIADEVSLETEKLKEATETHNAASVEEAKELITEASSNEKDVTQRIDQLEERIAHIEVALGVSGHTETVEAGENETVEAHVEAENQALEEVAQPEEHTDVNQDIEEVENVFNDVLSKNV